MISIEINKTFICTHEGNIFTKDIIITYNDILFDSLFFTHIRTYVSMNPKFCMCTYVCNSNGRRQCPDIW